MTNNEIWAFICGMIVGIELTDEQKQAETLFIKMNKWRREK